MYDQVKSEREMYKSVEPLSSFYPEKLNSSMKTYKTF